MKNLGKILYSIMIVQISLFASVKASLEDNPIKEGDAAVLIIEAEGKDIVFPEIKEIIGARVKDKSTTRNLVSINGKMHKTLIRRYRFYPQHAGTIPSYALRIEGHTVHTKALTLKIEKDIKDGRKAFVFEQKVDKKQLYVGEPLQLHYLFKQRVDIELSEANFNAPSFHGFWTKTTGKVPNKIEDGYNVYRINYLLYPQQSGTLKIESGRMDIGILSTRKKDFFNFKQARWKTIYSNPLEVEVKPLPKGVSLYGDYTFSVVADKNKTKANEPINLTITIQGEGNVDDIDDFKIDIPHATVYADKAKRSANLTQGKLRVLFKQKFAIVSDRNFTIPALTFCFFNGKIEEKKSHPITVEVTNANLSHLPATLEKKEPQESLVKEKIVYQERSLGAIMIVGVLSFLAGMLMMWLWMQKRLKKVKKDLIQTNIKNAKEDKALLALLLPYIDKTEKMQSIITKLEENIYHGSAHKIDRNSLAKEFESYLIKEKEEEVLQ